MLVNAGKITAEELDEVLQSQVIFGGKLGTNLLEMGFIEEHDLAHFLGKKLGAPAADKEQLMHIPADVIGIITPETAGKYKVVPFKVENKRLSLVMVDPSDLEAIDAISFSTGYIIRPLIAPELRILQCLEKYYGIKRELRYINIAGGSSRGRKRKEQPAPAVVQKHAEDHQVIELEEAEIVDFPEFNGFDKLPEEPKKEPAKVAETSEKYPKNERYTIDQMARDLVTAENRDDIAEAVLRLVCQEFNRVAFFVVKGGQATGWQGVVSQKPLADFDKVQIPFDSPSLLKIVADQKSFYLGPVPDVAMNKTMLQGFGGSAPAAALLLPLVMMGRVVAVLYLDGEPTLLSGKLKEMQLLIAKASMSFEILIMKSKILMT
jgi:hypothetical protein